MKVVVQRVLNASVRVSGKQVSDIGRGFVLLVGFTHKDTMEEVRYIARKVSTLRVFSDSEGKMNLDIHKVQGDILSISQFTLYGDTRNSNRPSFTEAMAFETANRLYEAFNEILRTDYRLKVQGGVFGEHMEVALTNDGPVTIIIEK